MTWHMRFLVSFKCDTVIKQRLPEQHLRQSGHSHMTAWCLRQECDIIMKKNNASTVNWAICHLLLTEFMFLFVAGSKMSAWCFGCVIADIVFLYIYFLSCYESEECGVLCKERMINLLAALKQKPTHSLMIAPWLFLPPPFVAVKWMTLRSIQSSSLTSQLSVVTWKCTSLFYITSWKVVRPLTILISDLLGINTAF